MAFDLDAFLKDLGATGDDEKVLREKLSTPERLSQLEKNQLRLSDYSRNQDDLRKTQDALAKQKDRLDAEAVEWGRLTAAEQERATTLRDSLEKTEAKVLSLTQRVTRIATDAGLDPAKALEGIEQAPPKKETVVPPVDTSRFVDQDRLAQLGNFMFNLAMDLPAIIQEHFELTGERLDPRAIRTEIEARASQKGANLDARTIWEEKFKIGEKRSEKATAQRAAEIKEAEDRGFTRARTEAALPVPPSHGLHSAVLRTVGDKGHESVLKRPMPESGVRAAAQKLSELRNRPQSQGAA